MQLEVLQSHKNTFFKKTKFLLRSIDLAANFILYPYTKINLYRLKKWLRPLISEDRLSEKQQEYLLNHNTSVFKRDGAVYNWIFNYPWITTNSNDKTYYPFSSEAKVFYYKFFSLETENHKICAFAMLKFCDGKIAIPYYYAEKGFDRNLSMAIVAYCYSKKATILTSYNSEFRKALKNEIGIAFLRKNMTQKYFISKVFKNTIPLNNIQISAFDGDGDCIFT